jgi:hypothetical protein
VSQKNQRNTPNEICQLQKLYAKQRGLSVACETS